MYLGNLKVIGSTLSYRLPYSLVSGMDNVNLGPSSSSTQFLLLSRAKSGYFQVFVRGV